MDLIDEMTMEIVEVNHANGWYDEDRPFAADIALLHSEVSEAFEAFRIGGVADLTQGEKPEGVGSEFADVLIRLLDTCARYDIDIVSEYHRKMVFNKTRAYRHGGKRL